MEDSVFGKKPFKFLSLAKHGFVVLVSEPMALKMVCLNIISLRTGIKEKSHLKRRMLMTGENIVFMLVYLGGYYSNCLLLGPR